MNAAVPIEVTEFGITMSVKPEQPENVRVPIDVTEFGITKEAKPLQPSNAL